MTVQGGKHQLVGMVSLGEFYQDMKRVETGDLIKLLLVIIIIIITYNSHAIRAIKYNKNNIITSKLCYLSK